MKMNELTERELSVEEIYNGTILRVEIVHVELPNGKTSRREVIRHVGAAAVVPLDDEGHVTMVKQYRMPFNRVLLEIPAGKKDRPGEDGLSVARRELGEETGLTAKRFVHLTDLQMTPGYSDEVISLYLALDLSQGAARPDEDEFLNVVKIPFSQALRMVSSGEIADSKTVCALMLAKEAVKSFGSP